jgi:steroid 5-alpha reductase family enzyme
MATLISPVFVYLLLTRVSGVPLLEKKSDSKWGGHPEYEAYKATTPELVPKLW